MIAYLATNIITGRRYVGITTQSLRRRWAHHLRQAARGSKSCRMLGASIRRHGAEAFTVEEIASARTREDLRDLERALIVQWGTLAPAGYNLTAGGDGGFSPSEATRALLSAAAKLRPLPPEMREIRVGPKNGMHGKKMSPSSRAKMSASHMGKKHTEETRAKIAASNSGAEFSIAHRANLSASAKARSTNATAGHLRVFSEAQRGKAGRIPTEEDRKRMGEAQKARWARWRAEHGKSPRQS